MRLPLLWSPWPTDVLSNVGTVTQNMALLWLNVYVQMQGSDSVAEEPSPVGENSLGKIDGLMGSDRMAGMPTLTRETSMPPVPRPSAESVRRRRKKKLKAPAVPVEHGLSSRRHLSHHLSLASEVCWAVLCLGESCSLSLAIVSLRTAYSCVWKCTVEALLLVP